MSREVMQQALEFCEFLWREVAMNDYAEEKREATEAALRAALAEPVQEPVALKWLPAPRKTEWGFGMVSADVEIDRDHTLTLYCEDDQTAKVDAMFRRVFCKEEA